MVIITTFEGNQKKFHTYWLPLMYKHQECQFYVSGKFTYPSDLKNLHVNKTRELKSGPILRCSINNVPTYKAMIELQKKSKNWVGTEKELNEKFYEV